MGKWKRNDCVVGCFATEAFHVNVKQIDILIKGGSSGGVKG